MLHPQGDISQNIPTQNVTARKNFLQDFRKKHACCKDYCNLLKQTLKLPSRAVYLIQEILI